MTGGGKLGSDRRDGRLAGGIADSPVGDGGAELAGVSAVSGSTVSRRLGIRLGGEFSEPVGEEREGEGGEPVAESFRGVEVDEEGGGVESTLEGGETSEDGESIKIEVRKKKRRKLNQRNIEGKKKVITNSERRIKKKDFSRMKMKNQRKERMRK